MGEDVSLAAGKVNGAAPPDTLRRFALGAIYVLSALVIVALAGVVYAIFARSAHPMATAAAKPQAEGVAMAGDIQLPAGAIIQSLQVSGDRLVLSWHAGSRSEIDIIDLHTGQRLARITGAAAVAQP